MSQPKDMSEGNEAANPLDNIAFDPLDFAQGTGDQIFNALKSAILKVDIPPGARLSEADTAARFGASRTPVREAFLQLRNAGMINTLPSRGNFVTKLSEHKIREARFIREALELAIVERAADVGLDQINRDELQTILQQQKQCIEGDRPSEFQRLDNQFHIVLASVTGYPRLVDLLGREKMQLDRLRMFSLRDHPRMEELYAEHVQIYNAVEKQDGEAARTLMKTHLGAILGTLDEMAKIHAEYFE